MKKTLILLVLLSIMGCSSAETTDHEIVDAGVADEPHVFTGTCTPIDDATALAGAHTDLSPCELGSFISCTQDSDQRGYGVNWGTSPWSDPVLHLTLFCYSAQVCKDEGICPRD